MVATEKRIGLTKRQQEIYEFLKDKIENRGYGPTVREIGIQFNISSPNGVMCHLKALERKGLIVRESNMSRAICLSGTAQKQTSLPLLGTAVSGSPIRAAVSSEDQVPFADLFEGEGRVCLQVQGTAFHTLGIYDGDYVILNRHREGIPGDLVAVLDESHSVKFCRVPSGSNSSASATDAGYPAVTRQVLGTVIGVVHKLNSVVQVDG